MNHKFRKFLIILSVLFFFSGFVSGARALTVNTTPATEKLRGETIRLELKVGSGGVGSSPKTPLGTVRGKIGESIDLGTLSKIPNKPVELRVILSSGSYYRSVTKRSLEQGTIDLTVYPYSPEQSYKVLQHGLLVQPFPNRIMVREYLVVNNPSNSHLAGGTANPLTFDLPDKVGEIHPGPGMLGADDLKQKNGYYRYELMFPPGRTVLGFFYMLRTKSDPYTFNRKITVPTQTLVLSIPSYPKLDVSVDGLRKMKRERGKKKGPNRLRYIAQNLKSGDRFSAVLKGISQVNPMGRSKGKRGGKTKQPKTRGELTSLSSVSWPLVLGIGLSVLIFFGAYGYVRYKLANAQSRELDPSFLVEEIARLDQEYEDGAINEAYYKRTRRRWKEAASDLADESTNG